MEEIGHINNQDNINAILGSIIDTDKDYFRWNGVPGGIELTINNHQIFISNNDDVAAKAFELYEIAKNTDSNE